MGVLKNKKTLPVKEKMRKLLIAFALLCSFAAQGQQLFTAPIPHWQGMPTGAPSSQGGRVRYDLLSNDLYTWVSANSTWAQYPKGIDRISGTIPPAYTPNAGQSDWAVNGANPPELYYYTGSVWLRANPVGTDAQTLTWSGSTGELSISGGNTVDLDGRYLTAEVDGSVTNELQTISLSGQTLTLSNGGGTVEIPASADGNGIYSGSGNVPDLAAANLNGSFSLGSFSTPFDPASSGMGLLVDPSFLLLSNTVASDNNATLSLQPGNLSIGVKTPTDGKFTTYAVTGSQTVVSAGELDKDLNPVFVSQQVDPTNGVLIEHSTPGGGAELKVKYKEFSVFTDSPEGTFGLRRSDGSGTITASIPEGLFGLDYQFNNSANLIGGERNIPDVGAVNLMLGISTTVSAGNSADANAAAITAGLSAGQPYRWDDGSSIHLMFVR